MSMFSGMARPEAAAYEADAELELFLLAAADMVGEDALTLRAPDGGTASRSRWAGAVVALLGFRSHDSAEKSTRLASLPRHWCAGDLVGLATLPLAPDRPSQR